MTDKIEVEPQQLATGRAQHASVAAALAECAGMMSAASQGLADGAGHPSAMAAGEAYGASWGAHLTQARDSVELTGADLAAAAEAYRETDDGQMRS